jgi:hypothetical protein
MSVAAYILLSLLTMLSAFVAYMWYITPSPKDLAEDILRHARPLSEEDRQFATRPRPDMTYINCLS